MRLYKGNFGWTRVLIFAFPYIIVVVLFQLMAYAILGIDISEIGKANIQENLAYEVLINFFSLLGTISVVWLFVKTIDRRKFISIGLQLKGFKHYLTGGLLFGVITIGLGFLILLMLGHIKVTSFDFSATDLILSIAIFTFVSLSEEILFRGYILRNLMISFNRYLTLFISSVLFAALHLANPHIGWTGFTNLFLAGVILGLPYIYTKNLWFPIGMHLTWNLTQTVLGFNVSGNTSYSIINISNSGSPHLHGGEFGFEGSIICTIISLATIVALWSYFSGKEKAKQIAHKAQVDLLYKP
jgi:uncharacterized protein